MKNFFSQLNPAFYIKRSSIVCAGLWVMIFSSFTAADELSGFLKNHDKLGENFIEGGSFKKAKERYQSLKEDALTKNELLWRKFRILDCEWHEKSNTRQTNRNWENPIKEALLGIIKDLKNDSFHEYVKANIHESLGEIESRRHGRYQRQQWSHYFLKALDYWAESSPSEYTKDKYLSIVDKLLMHTDSARAFRSGLPRTYIQNPEIEVLSNALILADSDEQIARYAMYYAGGQIASGGPRKTELAIKKLEVHLGNLNSGIWKWRVMNALGNILENTGSPKRLDNGNWGYERDLVRAKEYYRTVLQEDKKNLSGLVGRLEQRISNIEKKEVLIYSDGLFRSGADIVFPVAFKNIKELELKIIPLSLDSGIKIPGGSLSRDSISSLFRMPGDKPVHTAQFVNNEAQSHLSSNEVIRLKNGLETGAYMVAGKGGGIEVFKLLIVTDAMLVSQTHSGGVSFFLTDAKNGHPISDVELRILRGIRSNNRNRTWSYKEYSESTNKSGLMELNNARINDLSRSRLVVFGDTPHGPVIYYSYSHYYNTRLGNEQTQFYAFTDRAAYRPGDTVNWKVVVRNPVGGEYQIPKESSYQYEIHSPRGQKVASGTMELNEFGSMAGDLPIKMDLPLGAYRIQFKSTKDKYWKSHNSLFRLEEYKLPDFFVEVQVPETDSGPVVYKPGDQVEVAIDAKYYFGAPVRGGEVEAVVKREIWNSLIPEPRPGPWFLNSDARPYYPRRGNSQQILRTNLKLDDAGRAILRFPTEDLENGVDYKFLIEVSVKDQSLVSVKGNGSIKVTEKPYFTSAELKHVVHKPGDLVEIEWTFRDANESPFPAKGYISISEQIPNPQYEEWKKLRDSGKVSSRRLPEIKEFSLKHIENVDVEVDKSGKYLFSWRPETKGLYQFRWVGEGIPAYLDENRIVTAWVLAKDQEIVHYRSGGVEIILDKQTLTAGDELLYVVSSKNPGASVWLAYEIGNSWTQQIIKLKGNAQIMRFKISPKISRNFFIHAVAVNDYQFFKDSEEVIVPPDHKIAHIEIKPSESTARPGTDSLWTIKALNNTGEAITGEISLAIFDKSIEQIQTDFASPIEKYFYGHKYSSGVRVSSMLSYGSFQNKSDDSASNNNIIDGYGLITNEKRVARYSVSNSVSEPAARGTALMTAIADAPDMEMQMGESMALAKSEAGGSSQKDIVVRNDFRKTAYWNPTITLDEEGEAQIKFKLPDSLTTWQAVGRFIDKESRVAQSTSSLKTQNPLSVRLEMPRFMVEGDRAEIRASVINQTDSNQSFNLSWVIPANGLSLEKGKRNDQFSIQPRQELVIPVQVMAHRPGEMKVGLRIQSNKFSEGLEQTFPVYVHGFEKLDFRSGNTLAKRVKETISLPTARDKDKTSMLIRITPSLSVTMLDALPYLIEYPYGCTEQTMSRFMPAVVVSKTLNDFGLDPDHIENRIFGGIDQKFKDSVHANKDNKYDDLDKVIEDSLQRLYDFQKPSGGWGWWKQSREDIYMSAYVVYGLSLAAASEIDVDKAILEKGRNYLLNILGTTHEQPDLASWVLRALGESRNILTPNSNPEEKEVLAFSTIWRTHPSVNAYTRSLMALVAYNHGELEKAKLLVRNLENGVIQVDHSSTIQSIKEKNLMQMAHWGKDKLFFRWSESAVEATAVAIEAISSISPESELLVPAVNWLLAHRRAASWNNTKDTSLAVLALNSYVRKTGELENDLDVEVIVNEKRIATINIDKKSILNGITTIEVPDSLMDHDLFEIEFVRSQTKSRMYYSIETQYFSLEKPIQPEGSTLFVKRSINQIKPTKTLLKGYKNTFLPLNEKPKSVSGDKIKVQLRIENKIDLEYVMIEDFKPAGLEFSEVRSGKPLRLQSIEKDKHGQWLPSGRSISVYNEWRDNRCVLFIDKLPEGIWQVDYQAQTQVPGQFHALPVSGQAMYVPEIRGNGLEHLWSVSASN